MPARPTESARPGRAPRWWRYLRERRLVCPCGHHVPHNFRVTESGYIRCQKWLGAEECGAWVYLFAVRGGGIVAAAVTLEEMRELERLATPAEIIDFLGIWEQASAAA